MVEEENQNIALADEIEAINSIYGQGIIRLTTPIDDSLATILQLPNTPYAFTLTFKPTYPDTQPHIQGVHSVGAGGPIGGGKATEALLADILKRVWIPGQVCLFDLLVEVRLALECSGEKDGDDDNNVEKVVNPDARTTYEQIVIAAVPKDHISSTMYAALIRTHHITSRKKVATLKAAAKQIGCAALLRSGGTPGVMYVESKHLANVKKWVDVVHELRYKDYQLVSPPGVVPGRRSLVEAAEKSSDFAFDFEEVGNVKDFGAKMQEKGIVDWWRRAMGYISE